MPQSFGRLPPEVLRRRYVQLHKLLQEATKASAALQIRNEILEAENKSLHYRLDLITDCESALIKVKEATKEAHHD